MKYQQKLYLLYYIYNDQKFEIPLGLVSFVDLYMG